MSAQINNSRTNFIVTKVFKHDMLNQTDIINNHNKFYELKLEISSTGEYRIATRYGRVGESGKTNYHYLPSSISTSQGIAEKEYDSLMRKKSKYRKIEVETTTTSAGPLVLTQLYGIDKLIMQLYDEAVNMVKKHVQAPLGKLTQKQITKTKAILDDLYQALSSKSSYNVLANLSSDLYTNLPQVSASRLVALPVINDFRLLQEQIELVDIIQSLVTVQSALDGDAKAKYDATGAKIEILPQDCKEWKRIEKYINSTESKHHNAKLHVKEIYTVSIKGEDKRFNPKKIKTLELFHGTRSANILNILNQGLLIKPKTAVHTGSMFGNGIYFADQSTKSSQYAHKYASNKYPSSFLFLCDVATGNIKKYNDAQSHLHSSPTGYDSVQGVEGRSLIHNEYIVYNPNQSLIKYLIEFTVSSKH
jgi:poly [ADP-ribose] polymerase